MTYTLLDGSLIKKRNEYAEYAKKSAEAYNLGFNAGLSGEPIPQRKPGWDYLIDCDIKRGYEDGKESARDYND